MKIRIDESPNSVVVYCEDCGHWRAFAWDRIEGEKSGERHEENVHPDNWEFRRQVGKSRRLRLARLTAAATNAPERPDDSTHGNSGATRTGTRDERSAQLVVPAGHHVTV